MLAFGTTAVFAVGTTAVFAVVALVGWRHRVANRVLRHNRRNDMNVVQGLADRIETPLHHGGGMGTWLAFRSMQAAGGELIIEQCPEEGSVIELRYPTPDD